MGLMRIKFGDQVSANMLDRYRGSKGSPAVISILRIDPIVTKYHYSQNTGYFYCFEGACCESLGLPNLRYIFPIALYTLHDEGYALPFDIRYLQVGRDVYEGFITKNKIIGDLSKKDMLVTTTDEQYQKHTFEIYDDALWRSNEEGLSAAKEALVYFDKFIEMSVAKTIDPSRFKALISEATPSRGTPLTVQEPLPQLEKKTEPAKEKPTVEPKKPNFMRKSFGKTAEKETVEEVKSETESPEEEVKPLDSSDLGNIDFDDLVETSDDPK